MSEPPKKPSQLWIVLPVYYDVASFSRLRTNILNSLQHSTNEAWSESRVQFVVVDDSGGNDPQIRSLHEHEDTFVLTPPFNLGHQRAIVFGLRKIAPWVHEADCVVTMDSDGEDRPEDLPAMLRMLLSPGEEENLKRLVLAKRTKRQESLWFRLFYVFFKFFFRMLTGTVVKTGNYAAFRGWFAQHIIYHPNFDLCYSSGLFAMGMQPAFVPCPRGERYEGQSKMNLVSLTMHGLRMLMPFVDRIAIRSLMGFFIVLALSVVGTIGGLVNYFILGTAFPDWGIQLIVVLSILSMVALGNFLVLFTSFSQSRGLSLNRLEGVTPQFGHDDASMNDLKRRAQKSTANDEALGQNRPGLDGSH